LEDYGKIGENDSAMVKEDRKQRFTHSNLMPKVSNT